MAEVKKKPGRPRKTPIKKPLKRNGIAKEPLNKENYMEMIYDMPSVMKRIFTLFKSLAIKELCIEFGESDICIFTTDHLKKSNVKVCFKCAKINHYYCEAPIKINLNPDNVEKIIQVLNKDYTSIVFTLKKSTNRSILNIIFKNHIKIDEYREIDIIQTNDNNRQAVFDTLGYPVQFVFPSKYFKKLVGDVSTFADTLTINKVGEGPLTFSYISKDKTVKAKYVVQSPEPIKLKSLVAKGEIFSSSVRIDYIKPLSSSLLSESIHVAADSHKNMIFRSSVDNNTIDIFVNTETVNLKK